MICGCNFIKRLWERSGVFRVIVTIFIITFVCAILLVGSYPLGLLLTKMGFSNIPSMNHINPPPPEWVVMSAKGLFFYIGLCIIALIIGGLFMGYTMLRADINTVMNENKDDNVSLINN